MADEPSPLGTIELAATSFYVQDIDAAVEWYGTKFGLRPAMVGTDGHRYASFLMGSAFVVLEPREAALEPAEPGPETTTVNLIVDRDPAEVRAELVGRGVPCGELVRSPNYLSFLVRDLDGNRFYVTRQHTRDGDAAGSG
ncbi:MAG TPA: VOC family protein [Acidimicrobiales bacterium]|nr:VOC family protein [Acidimicrobiales bacterium]